MAVNRIDRRSLAAPWAGIAVLTVLILPSHAAAADSGASAGLGEVLTARLTAQLVGLFIVATVLESALTTLFNWRVYREFFNGRAFKTLIMVGIGYAVVLLFNYDIMAGIISDAGGNGASGPGLSQFLSAFVLAGGSSAVNQLFRALGLRPPVDPETPEKMPPRNQAWASVRIVRSEAVGDIEIGWDVVETPTDEQKKMPAIAGVVGQSRTVRQRLGALFFADPMRLPSYGGRTVNAGETVYRIVATARVKDREEPITREIYVGRFADRAIVDFVETI